jgi:hypothetical protein
VPGGIGNCCGAEWGFSLGWNSRGSCPIRDHPDRERFNSASTGGIRRRQASTQEASMDPCELKGKGDGGAHSGQPCDVLPAPA